MSDEENEQPRMVYFDQSTGRALTPEEHLEVIARQQMAEQDFHSSVRRVFFVELADDQLETMRRLFRTLGNLEDPKAWVNYYEGLVDGAWHAREYARQTTPADGIPDAEQFIETGTLAEHPWQPTIPDPNGNTRAWECGFSTLVEGIENAVDCGLPRNAKPHTDWAKNHPTT